MVIEREECRKGYCFKHSLCSFATILHVSSFNCHMFLLHKNVCNIGICWAKLHAAFVTDANTAHTFLCRRSFATTHMQNCCKRMSISYVCGLVVHIIVIMNEVDQPTHIHSRHSLCNYFACE